MGNNGDGLQAPLGSDQAPAPAVATRPAFPSSDDGEDDTINPNLCDSLRVARDHGFFFKSGHLPTGKKKGE